MTRHDEEAPLLPKKAPTPLPWEQLIIILVLQLGMSEPLTSNVIYPFSPQLIRDIGITNGDESKVGYYVGLMQSLFFLTQACTVLHWSRLSDYVGRKPVILIGLFGLSLSMYSFGLSKTFWGLVLSRSLNGALNGNIGVIKSMIAEITDSTNIAVAYSFMPIAWSTGSTVGPIIGGMLSRPAIQFPSWFGESDFLKEYPYFLPCAIPATFSAIAWLVTFLCLEETVPNPMPFSRLLNFRKPKVEPSSQEVVAPQEPHSTAVSPAVATMRDPEKPPTLRELCTSRVLLAAGNYATLSLIDISFRAIQPVFLSTPIHMGGLGLPPSTIGKILSVFGILNGVFQVCYFARIHDYWGSKKTFVAGIVGCFPLMILFPIANHFARVDGAVTLRVWIVVGIQIVISVCTSLSYGSVFIYISSAAPRSSLGAVNGLAQMSVSIMRAVGPAIANSVFSLSIERPLPVIGGSLVYVMLSFIVAISVYVASLLPHRAWST